MPAAHFSDEARREREQRTIERALKVFERRARYRRAKFDSTEDARIYLRLRLGGLEREEFWAVWLDAQNRVIADERLFVGTLTQTVIHMREVVKSGLWHNAAQVILAHNHPGGSVDPSRADIELTHCIKNALAMVEIGLLDHIIVGDAPSPTSLAEMGII